MTLDELSKLGTTLDTASQQGDTVSTDISGTFKPKPKPVSPYQFPLVDPNNQDPNTLAAQLINAQFSEWESTFKPIELNALQQVSTMNPQVLMTAVNTANQNASGTADTMSGILQRENSSQGIIPTDQQKKTTQRILDVDKSLMVAGAENKARQDQRDLDTKILTGASPNPNIVSSKNIPNPMLS